MARRRLRTLLASTMLLTVALAGPAAASDLVPAVEDVVEVTSEAVPAAAAVEVAPVVEAVTEATASVTEAVADVAPAAAPAEEAAPETPASSGPVATRSTTPTAAPVEGKHVVSAGGVTSAPPIEMLVGLGGSEPTPGRAAPSVAPAAAPAATTTDEIPAPMVAPPAPAAATGLASPSILTQALDDLPAEGAPALAVVALAALLAAGAGTLQTARTELAG